MSISARRGGGFTALRLAVALAALGGICLVAGAVVSLIAGVLVASACSPGRPVRSTRDGP